MFPPGAAPRSRADAGLTLIESIFAVAALAVVALSLASLLSSTVGGLGEARLRLQAATVADGAIEELRARPWAQMPAAAASFGSSRPGYDLQAQVLDVSPDLRRLAVTARAARPGAPPFEVTTYVARR